MSLFVVRTHGRKRGRKTSEEKRVKKKMNKSKCVQTSDAFRCELLAYLSFQVSYFFVLDALLSKRHLEIVVCMVSTKERRTDGHALS